MIRAYVRRIATGSAVALVAFTSGLGWAAEPLPLPAVPLLPIAPVVPVPAVPTPATPRADSSLGPSQPFGQSAAYSAAVLATSAAGRTPGTFAVSNSGAATYTIPLWTPPGVGSVDLSLALTYGSRAPDGVMGVGWSLAGLSAITRCNKTWAQDGAPGAVTHSLSDRFCLDGQQLKLVSGTYGQAGSVYATEIESFAKIVASGTVGSGPASFTVTTKNGLVYEYGTTTDSQVYAGTSGTVRTWAVARIRDRAAISTGNSIAFTYTNEARNGAYTNGSYRIASITYPTTATGQGPFHQVLFSYGARPATDVVSGWLAGYAVREPHKLNTITVQRYTSGTTIKRYELSYTASPTTNRLRLGSVQECSAANCLAPTNIAYQDGQAGWETTAIALGQATAHPARVLPVDLNGDGIADLVYPVNGGNGYYWYVMFGSASGSFAASTYTGVSTVTGDNLIPADFAARGQLDLLYPSAGFWYRLYWNGTALATASTGNPISTPQGSSAGATAADVNGDGLPDLVWHFNEPAVGGGAARIFVQLNTTVPGAAVTFSATPVSWITYINDATTTWTFLAANGPISAWSSAQAINVADFNGDGRAEILVHLQREVSTCPPLFAGEGSDALAGEGAAPSACTTTRTYFWRQLISTGSAFLAARSFTQAVAGTRFGLIDWNGDGCTDVFGPTSTGGYWQVYPSTCHVNGGFANPINSGLAWTALTMASDWDADGRQDLLVASGGKWKVIRSGGEGISGTLVDSGVSVGSGAWFVADLDGDGLTDLGWVDQQAGNALKINAHRASGSWPDLATSFTDGFGMSQNPAYVSIARGQHTKYADAPFPEFDYAGPLQVVSQFVATDGTGSTYQNQFWYYGARVHAQGRGFEGFYAQRIYDTRNGLYTFDYVERTFPYAGLHRFRYVSDGAALLWHWDRALGLQTLGTGYQQRYFPYIAIANDTRYEHGGSLHGTQVTHASTSYTYGDGYGNPTQVVRSVTDTDPGSPFLGSTWTTTLASTFSNDIGTHCLGLPTATTTTESAPGQSAQTRTAQFTVDTSSCRISQQVLEPASAPLKVTTTLGFDGCGNVNSVQVVGANPNGSAMPARTTSFGYGTRCQLPETLTNALDQPTTVAYDYDFGVPTQSTDPNALATTWTYDDFGRRTLETRPDGTRTAWAFESCTTGPCWGVNDLRFLTYESLLGTDGSAVMLREYFYDGFERLRYDEYHRVLGTWTAEVFYYDSLGRRTAQVHPYSSAGNGWLSWSYDALDRPTAQRLYQPNGALDRTTSFGYQGRTTSVTDPLGHTRSDVRDVRGRLRRVIDPLPGGTTRYDYDAFGQLNRIEDAIGAVSTGSYNLRGFRTSWADVDRGSWSLSGNSLNELVGWTNARGQSFSAIYDPLGRMTSRTEPEGTSSWIWGSSAAAHEIGRLKSVSGYGYSETRSYDGAGRLATRWITTDQTYQYDYTYNTLGALDTLTYPTSPVPAGQSAARFKVQYGYSYGEPWQINDITDGTPQPLWTLGVANDFSSPTSETFGAGVVSRSTGYTPWTNEVNALQAGTGGSGTNQQYLAYQWDTAGNLTQRQDLRQGRSEGFTYDALDRLTATSGNAVPNLTLAYDASGNLNSKSDVGNYTYHASKKHAVTAAGSNTFAYDANGNQTSRNGFVQEWASYDLPTRLRGGSYQSDFAYGPEHARWRQVASYSNGTETTHYVGGRLEKMAASSTGVSYWRHYVPTPGGTTLIVSRNSNATTSTSYLLSDHLGSTDTVLEGNGTVGLRTSFDAFGRRRGSDWNTGTAPDWGAIGNTTREGYTGHEMLDNVALIHLNGRVYDPVIGRVLSVDPLIGDLADSQSVNPYAYVGDRPLSYTDPNGYLADGGCLTLGWCRAVIAGVVSTVANFLSGRSEPAPPSPLSLPGPSAQGGTGQCGPGNTSASCTGLILYAGVAAHDSGVPSSSWGTSADPLPAPYGNYGEPGARAAAAGWIIAMDPNIPRSVKLILPLVVAGGSVSVVLCASAPAVCTYALASVDLTTTASGDLPLMGAGKVASGIGGAAKSAGTVARTPRSGETAVRITRADGSVIDISPTRVKEYLPNTHPSAPPGTMDRVRYPNAEPGSKGYKRDPTPEELEILRNLK